MKASLRSSDAVSTSAYSTMDDDVDNLCNRLQQDSNSTRSILQLMASIQEHCSEVQQAAATTRSLSQQVKNFDTLVRVCRELEQRLQVLEGEQDAAQQTTKEWQKELGFLSLLHEHAECCSLLQKHMFKAFLPN